MNRHLLTFFIASVLAASPSFARFSAEARKVSNFADACKTVVVAPVECPTSVDCLKIESSLADLIGEKARVKVVGADKVRQALFDMGLDANAPDFRQRLLSHFSADAIAVATIPGLETQDKGATAVWTGTTMVASNREQKSGDATISILNAEGRKLMEGVGHGASRNAFRSEKGLVTKIFRLILEEAFKSDH